jgi:hypothetical protein
MGLRRKGRPSPTLESAGSGDMSYKRKLIVGVFGKKP